MAVFSLSVTNAGLSMITDTAFGGTIIFTGILMGSGSTSESAQSMSSLVKEEVSLPISSCTKNGNTVVLKTELQPDDVTETFIWREVGIKAKSSSDGVEILYAYGNAGNLGDTIPGPESGTLDERILEFSVIVGNTSNVVAELKSGLYVSKEELEIVAKGMIVTLTHSKEGTVHVFTGLEGKTGLVPCQFKSTAGYTEGDTATIDGEAYTIVLTSADEPETDLFITGRSIIVDVDTESKTINFKAGGGLTNGKLALADATEDTVFNGRTFYAGNSKEIRTGRAMATATNVTAAKMFAGVTAYNQQGQLITGNPAATNVTATKMFTGTTAFDRNGNLITGAPPATTAVESDVKSGKTYYDNNGVLKTGTRSTEPVMLHEGYLSLPYSTSEQTYTISVPSSASNWVFFTVCSKYASYGDSYYSLSGTITKFNHEYGSNFDGRIYLTVLNTTMMGSGWWTGSAIKIKKNSYGEACDIKYRFYGYN